MIRWVSIGSVEMRIDPACNENVQRTIVNINEVSDYERDRSITVNISLLLSPIVLS